MSAADLTLRARAAAERLMTDTVRIYRKAGEPVTDPVTAEVTYPESVVYTGRGRVQSSRAQASSATRDDAAQLWQEAAAILQVPIGTDVREDDEVEVVTPAMGDLVRAGRRLTVTRVGLKTHASMVRATVEEVR